VDHCAIFQLPVVRDGEGVKQHHEPSIPSFGLKVVGVLLNHIVFVYSLWVPTGEKAVFLGDSAPANILDELSFHVGEHREVLHGIIAYVLSDLLNLSIIFRPIMYFFVDFTEVNLTGNLYMVAGVHLSEILSKFGDGARLEVVTDSSSRDLHRPAANCEISFTIRLLGVHAVMDVLLIKGVGHSIYRVRASDPTATFTNVSVRDRCHMESSEAFSIRAFALDFFLCKSMEDFIRRLDCHALLHVFLSLNDL